MGFDGAGGDRPSAPPTRGDRAWKSPRWPTPIQLRSLPPCSMGFDAREWSGFHGPRRPGERGHDWPSCGIWIPHGRTSATRPSLEPWMSGWPLDSAASGAGPTWSASIWARRSSIWFHGPSGPAWTNGRRRMCKSRAVRASWWITRIPQRRSSRFGCRKCSARPRLPPWGAGGYRSRCICSRPARRPVQVTRDLAGFWRTTYFEVRKDLKGRYPKHPLAGRPAGGRSDPACQTARPRGNLRIQSSVDVSAATVGAVRSSCHGRRHRSRRSVART